MIFKTGKWPTFEAFLLDPDGGGQLVVRLWPELGIWTGVTRKLFHYAIQLGQIDDYCTIEDNWCVRELEVALAALERWNPAVTPEPEGWHRHPQSGRRRPDADPAREYRSF